MLKQVMTVALVISAFSAQAKTATELFESVADSIVIVYAKDKQGKTQSLGSGVVLSAGQVVTNCHVVEKSVLLSVKYRAREYPATLKDSDYDRDVCSLTAPGLAAPAATLGSTKPLKVGQKVFAVGAPKGLELTLSEGIVSSLREIKSGRYLQISAPISPGSSGGGLFDEEGRLIGLPTFYFSDGQQLNFALPVEWIKELSQRQTSARPAAQTSVLWLNRAMEFENKKDWSGMLRHTLGWTKQQPNNADAWVSLGYAYVKSGQTAKGIESYQQALHINPEDALNWANLGYAYNQSGQIAKALESYQQALRINPEDALTWYNLGVNYGDSGQTAKAIESYQQALRINPENADAWHNLGNAYGNSGQIAKAIESQQQALHVNPDYADAWLNLGAAYVKSGQTAKGIESFQQALRINPKHARAWFNLGVAYKIDRNSNKVMEVYRELKNIDPQNADAFFNKIVLP